MQDIMIATDGVKQTQDSRNAMLMRDAMIKMQNDNHTLGQHDRAVLIGIACAALGDRELAVMARAVIPA